MEMIAPTRSNRPPVIAPSVPPAVEDDLGEGDGGHREDRREQEYSPPSEQLDDEASDGRAAHRARADGAELQSKGLAALALVEGREEDRRRGRLGHGRADAHEDARPDQRGDAAPDGAQHGSGEEYGEAGQVEPLPPYDVREPSHGQEQGADGEGIGDHHPLDGGQVGAELVGDAGEGDGYRAVVGDGHEYAERGGGVDPPAVASGDVELYVPPPSRGWARVP